MARPRNSVPKLIHHKSSGQARVTVGHEQFFLGKYGSAEANRRYARLLAELAASPTGRITREQLDDAEDGGPTVAEVFAAFHKHALQHYRRPDGTITSEVDQFESLAKVVCPLYADTPAVKFGALALRACREKMVALDWSRNFINCQTRRLRHVFRWAASHELVPASVPQALATVEGLRKGRSPARETEPVTAVALAHVEATLPALGAEVAAMVRVQLLTGMRPGEVVRIRPKDVDRSGPVWVYRPAQHKTAHKGKARTIAVGPQAQEILKRFEPADPEAYYFSPAQAVARRRAERAEQRKTPRYPSHMKRNATKRVRQPKRKPAARYTSASYSRAVARAIVDVNAKYAETGADVSPHVPHWWPNQLRHTHATEVRRRFGLEAAQVALGHASADVTQVYAERDMGLALKVAEALG